MTSDALPLWNSWATVEREDGIHVIPLHDLRTHTPEACWCDPSYDEEDGTIIHNAADQREEYSNGRLPS